MVIAMKEYRNKVLGCWTGKNIGGTLGAPFEWRRQVNRVEFYIQDLAGNPPANDDLDLQLVWLNAIEKHGKNLNAGILGEYWLDYITPNWVEYGAGKNNLRMGLVPPLSGYVNNPFRNSNGCWIRSEIWACIAPGHPEIAVKYAYEDAIVDHSGEGLYAEIFCAAVESAAFVEKDKNKLIDIGLSYIPSDCEIARGINLVIDCYKSGVSWLDTRKKLLTEVPGYYSRITEQSSEEDKKLPVPEQGWDAPSNIGIIIIGWLFGGDDFGKSLCIAVNCGEDTDCTAATLGSILGITHGLNSIPRKWIEPLGDIINTMCINAADFVLKIPGTITELTDRVLAVTPQILGNEICDCINSSNGYTIDALEGKALYCSDPGYVESLKNGTFIVKYDFNIYSAYLDYVEEPFIQANNPKKFILTIKSNTTQHQWINIRWYNSDDIKISPAPLTSLYLWQGGSVQSEFVIEAGNLNKNIYNLIIELSSNGHHTTGLIPVVLINGK